VYGAEATDKITQKKKV